MKKTVPVIFTIVLIILLGAAVFGKKLISRYQQLHLHRQHNR